VALRPAARRGTDLRLLEMFLDGDAAHDDPSFGSGSTPQPLFENGAPKGARSARLAEDRNPLFS
jgi:hypothetical protein